LARKRTPTYHPDRSQLDALSPGHNVLPVYRRFLADLETPVSVVMKLAEADEPAFLLESVEGGDQIGRYSFIGVRPRSMCFLQDGVLTIRTGTQVEARSLAAMEDPMQVLRTLIDGIQPVKLPGLPRFIGGMVGYLAYDVVRAFERLPATAGDDLHAPDMAFMVPDVIVVFDHVLHHITVLANAYRDEHPDWGAAYDDAVARIDATVARLRRSWAGSLADDPASEDLADPEFDASLTQAEYEAAVHVAKTHIRAGDAFQIVLSQRFSRETSATPLQIYRALRALNPSPYMFYLRFGPDLALVGASPEMMVRLEDDIATVRPIAGTRPRSPDPVEDDRLAAELLEDPKEVAEHVMLVDLGRNDLGRVCRYGTVRVTEMMAVERYSHVMHIVSQVEGHIQPGMDAFDLLRATFPAGTLSGAPKIRAMEIIEALEGTRRGPYGGTVGYFSYDGSMDMCITIRSMLLMGHQVFLQAGAGIVADSDPTTEYQECMNKMRAQAVALRFAELGLDRED
jgi:anthranilate synthase component I